MNKTIQESFANFHNEHNEVYWRLVSLALQAKAAGKEKWAIGNLWEILRWEHEIEGLPDENEDFKLNDHYRSRYARFIMEHNPELEGFFEVRVLTAP